MRKAAEVRNLPSLVQYAHVTSTMPWKIDVAAVAMINSNVSSGMANVKICCNPSNTKDSAGTVTSGSQSAKFNNALTSGELAEDSARSNRSAAIVAKTPAMAKETA